MAKCPSCGRKNKTNIKFCPECGFNLVNPPSKTDMRRGSRENELKLVTMLFADISGFTAMSSKLAADKVKEIIDALFSKLTAAIESERGKVIKYEGDCIMAAFGADASDELDPVHCCYAALKMRRELDIFNEWLKNSRGFDLEMRTGIHSGRAVVGLIGGSLDIIGDAVNIAARMEQNAGRGKIMLTAGTALQLKGRFLLEPLEPIRVKGKDEPVTVFNLIGKSAIKSRSVLGVKTEMIGRKKELNALIKSFGDAKKSKFANIFIIEGPAGCGKSRLIQEFEEYCKGLPDHTNIYKSYFNSTIASDYHVFKVFFKTICAGRTNEQALLERLKEAMPGFSQKRLEEYSKIIAYLLDFECAENEFVEKMKRNPKEIISLVFKAFEDFFSAAAAGKPYVFFIEDLHWADEGSLKLIEHLLRWSSSKLFFIATSRKAVKETGWNFPERKTSACRLNYFSESQSAVMIKNLLKTGGVQKNMQPVIDKICSVADGNPLFIEELVISMHDSRIIFKKDNKWEINTEKLQKITLPSTVETAIQARIDRLSSESVDLLKKASAIGRKFTVDALADLCGINLSNVLKLDLEEMIGKAILLNAGEGSYIFSHETIRDVVYAKLTRRQKRTLHEKIALRLENIMAAGGSEENIESMICFHFEAAQNIPATVHYAILAAEKAYGKYQLGDAVHHYGIALKYLSGGEIQMPENDLLRYLEGYCEAMIMAGKSARIIGILKAFESKTSRVSSALRLNLKKMQAYRVLSDEKNEWENLLNQTEAALTDAENISEIKASGGDSLYFSLLAGLYENLGVFYISFKGVCDKTLFYLKKALKLRLKAGCEDKAASCLTNMGFYHSIKGEHARATGYFNKALELAEKNGDKRITAICLINLGVICQSKSDFETAARHYHKALELAEEIGDRRDIAVSLINIGNIHCLKSEYSEALHCCEKALELALEMGHKRGISDWTVEIGDIYLKKGDYKKAAESYKKAMSISKEIDYKFCSANCLKGFANICVQKNDLKKAKIHYDEALKLYKMSGSLAEHDLLKNTLGKILS